MLANIAFSNISFSISCDCFVKARLSSIVSLLLPSEAVFLSAMQCKGILSYANNSNNNNNNCNNILEMYRPGSKSKMKDAKSWLP